MFRFILLFASELLPGARLVAAPVEHLITDFGARVAMLLAHVFIAAGVTAIYQRGREAGKPWLGQGFRFGLWFAVAAWVPGFLIYYAVQPTGLMLAVKQMLFGGIATVLLGLTAAAVNRQA